MSDWRPRDPTGGESGASPAPPGWGTPFPPEKPRRDAPAEAQQAPTAPAVNPYQPAPYNPTPYGAAPAAPPSSPPYGAAPGSPAGTAYGAAPAAPPHGAP